MERTAVSVDLGRDAPIVFLNADHAADWASQQSDAWRWLQDKEARPVLDYLGEQVVAPLTHSLRDMRNAAVEWQKDPEKSHNFAQLVRALSSRICPPERRPSAASLRRSFLALPRHFRRRLRHPAPAKNNTVLRPEKPAKLHVKPVSKTDQIAAMRQR